MQWTIDRIAHKCVCFIGSGIGALGGYGSDWSNTNQYTPTPAVLEAQVWARSAASGGPAFADTTAADIAKLSQPLSAVTPISAMPATSGGYFGLPAVKVDWEAVAKDPTSPYFAQAVTANMEGLTPETVVQYVNNQVSNQVKNYTTGTTPIVGKYNETVQIPGYSYSGTKASNALNSASSYLLANGYTADQILPAYSTIDQGQQWSVQANRTGLEQLNESINGEKDWSKRVGGVLSVALPASLAAAAGLATGGVATPVFGTIGGAAAGGAAGATVGAATSGHGTVGDVLKAGAIGGITGAVSGGVASGLSPAASNGIQSATGLSTTASNTIGGALTAAGTNAGVQYAKTGDVDLSNVAISGMMGGAKGYNTGTAATAAASPLNQPGYLNGGLNANDLYDSTGSVSLLGGNSGLSVDPTFDASFTPTMDVPSYYPTVNPGLSVMGGDSGLKVDTSLAPDFKSTYDTGIQPTPQSSASGVKVPYDKLIKTGLSLLGGTGGTTAAPTTAGGGTVSPAVNKGFTPWDKLADFKLLGGTAAADAPAEDNSFGLGNGFSANWYNYA